MINLDMIGRPAFLTGKDYALVRTLAPDAIGALTSPGDAPLTVAANAAGAREGRPIAAASDLGALEAPDPARGRAPQRSGQLRRRRRPLPVAVDQHARRLPPADRHRRQGRPRDRRGGRPHRRADRARARRPAARRRTTIATVATFPAAQTPCGPPPARGNVEPLRRLAVLGWAGRRPRRARRRRPGLRRGEPFDPGDGFDLHLTLDYTLDLHSAGDPPRGGRPARHRPRRSGPASDDLVFWSTKQTLVPRFELRPVPRPLGVRHPALRGVRKPELELDQRDKPCTFDIPGATCVSRMSSSTIRDGLLPMAGYDGENGGAGFTGNDPTVFRSPVRSGFDRLHLGVTYAPMNQARDDTKPTWKLGAEVRVAVGKVAAMNRTDPDAATGVGRGVHELRLSSTSIARRMGWAEPFFEAYWQAPIGLQAGSPFADPGFGARSTESQQVAGTRFGFEAFAVDQGPEGARFSLELSANLAAHFEGRACAVGGLRAGRRRQRRRPPRARRRSHHVRHAGPRSPRHHQRRELPRPRRPRRRPHRRRQSLPHRRPLPAPRPDRARHHLHRRRRRLPRAATAARARLRDRRQRPRQPRHRRGQPAPRPHHRRRRPPLPRRRLPRLHHRRRSPDPVPARSPR